METSNLQAAWDAAIADVKANKGTVNAVCKKHGVPSGSFYYEKSKRNGQRAAYKASYRAKKKAAKAVVAARRQKTGAKAIKEAKPKVENDKMVELMKRHIAALEAILSHYLPGIPKANL